MNAKMKKQLISDVLTGLAVAAVFTAVVPADALAQLATATDRAEDSVAAPFLKIVSYISYGIGTVMTIAGIAQAKKHADNPSQTPLGQALGRLGAGAAFLAAPWLAGTMMATGSSTFGGRASFEPITF